MQRAILEDVEPLPPGAQSRDGPAGVVLNLAELEREADVSGPTARLASGITKR